VEVTDGAKASAIGTEVEVWALKYVDIAAKDAARFLNEAQYAHAVICVASLPPKRTHGVLFHWKWMLLRIFSNSRTRGVFLEKSTYGFIS
jgi:hypothetical protein